MSLRVRGFRKTQSCLQSLLSSKTRTVDRTKTEEHAMVTARMVRAAAWHGIGRPTCLEESLALWWLLGRRGIPVELHIGVRKTGEKFEAHAWVEHDCRALNEAEAPHRHYAVIDVTRFDLPPEPQ
jgi:Transglutaminase-like superfamily